MSQARDNLTAPSFDREERAPREEFGVNITLFGGVLIVAHTPRHQIVLKADGK